MRLVGREDELLQKLVPLRPKRVLIVLIVLIVLRLIVHRSPLVISRLHQLVELGDARALLCRERLRCLRRLRQLRLVRLDALAHPLDRPVELHALGVRVEEVGGADVLAAALQQHLADRLVLVAVGLEPHLDGAAEVVAQAPAAGVGLVEPCHLGVVLALVLGWLPVREERVLPGIVAVLEREADQLAGLAQALEVDAQQQVLGVRVLQVGQLRLDGRHQRSLAVDLLAQLGDP